MRKSVIYNQILIVASLLLITCKKEVKPIKESSIQFQKEGELTLYKKQDSIFSIIQKIDIELAEDAYERQTGLMHRSEMGINQGMLFIFEKEQPQNFYMKNTLIPLDLLFINSQNQIVSFQENAKPLNEQSLPSNAPAQYVLEINGGLIDKWNVSVGDSISFTKN